MTHDFRLGFFIFFLAFLLLKPSVRRSLACDLILPIPDAITREFDEKAVDWPIGLFRHCLKIRMELCRKPNAQDVPSGRRRRKNTAAGERGAPLLTGLAAGRYHEWTPSGPIRLPEVRLGGAPALAPI